MQVDEIYRRRFREGEVREQLWSVLVDDFFQRYVTSTDAVLDVPCGYGEFINRVKCAKKYALDINPDAREHLAKDVEFLEASSTSMPLPDDSMDKIFVSNFFEHLTRADIVATIAEFKRVLKPGGQVLVLQPNIRFAHRNYWMFFDHITAIDDRALEEAFVIQGFSLKQRILKFLPFTTQGKLPTGAWLVRLYLKLKPAWRLLGQQSFLLFQK